MGTADFFNESNVALNRQANDAAEAIFLATELLRGVGAVSENYYDMVCANLEENGPYFVLAPGFAMPHAEPSPAVYRTACSLVTLEKPVTFGHPENDPVDVVLAIAAVDRSAMNETMITGVMNLLDSDRTMAAVRRAAMVEEILPLLRRVMKGDGASGKREGVREEEET